MTPEELYRDVLNPGLDLLAELGGPRRDARADVLLLAISGQEANWTAQRQHGGGPAHGLWQFERGGGVAGVLRHPASSAMARRLCERLGVAPNTRGVHQELALGGGEADYLDAGFARLLLWTDPRPLPALDDQDGAWQVYLRNWRPGRPRPEKWPGYWRESLGVLSR